MGAATIKEQSANLDLIMSRTIGLKGLCHAICHLFKNFKAKTLLASIKFQTVSCRLLLQMARMDMDQNNCSNAYLLLQILQ